MHKFAPALLALSLLLPTAIAAAQTQPAAPSPAPAPATSTKATSTMTATAPQPDFGELMSSLNNMRAEIAKIQAMNGGSANDLRPVNVAQLSGADSSALSTAVTKNQTQLNALRNTLSKITVTTMTNERISVAQFLADNRITLSQVVGADVNNGKLVLFYQKP
jgi:hypothetical protein